MQLKFQIQVASDGLGMLPDTNDHMYLTTNQIVSENASSCNRHDYHGRPIEQS
jgi:hypothetical protein